MKVQKQILKNTQSKRTQHNGQGNAKNVFSLTSEHKIISSRSCHASLSNDITHQNTRSHWFLLKSPGNLTLHYVALHYTFHTTIENFSACCNTSRGIKLAASQASHLLSACSLTINRAVFFNLDKRTTFKRSKKTHPQSGHPLCAHELK